jgi:hypothetical protein
MQFPHLISREGDANKHDHFVISSSVQCPDNKWRALHTRLLLRPGFNHKYGQYYRDRYKVHFEQQFKEYGIRLEPVPIRNGHRYTIVGFDGSRIPDKLIGAWSKRTAQIKAELAQRNLTEPTAKQLQAAKISSRKSKPKIEIQAVFFQECRQEAQEHYGFETEAFLHRSRQAYLLSQTIDDKSTVVTELPESTPVQKPQRHVQRIPEVNLAETVEALLKRIAEKANRIEAKADQAHRMQQNATTVTDPIPQSLPTPTSNVVGSFNGNRNVNSSTPQSPNNAQLNGKATRVPAPLTSVPEPETISPTTKLLQSIKDRVFGKAVHDFNAAMNQATASSSWRSQEFQVKLWGAYFTGKVRAKTFNRYAFGVGEPRSKFAIETQYWMGKLSLAQRIHLYLKQGHGVPTFGIPTTRTQINLAFGLGQLTKAQRLMLLQDRGLLQPDSPEIKVRHRQQAPAQPFPTHSFPTHSHN